MLRTYLLEMENSGRNKERDLLKSLMKEKYLCDVTLVAGNDAGDNKTKCVLTKSIQSKRNFN